MDLEPRFVDVRSEAFGEVTVHYRELGSGPPLLLIHGLMTTSYSWRYVLAPLSAHFRVIAPDLVGCGRTDKPDRGYGPREVAGFIGTLLDAFEMRGGPVVGNSMGGYLCMQLALDEPEAMRRLVNIHSPGLPMAKFYALRAAMALPGADRLLHRLVNLDRHRWVHRNVHYYDESLKSREEAREYGDPLASREGSRALARYLRHTLDPFEMRAFAKRLQRERFPIPLQLIYATRDPMVPPQMGTKLAKLVPSAEMVWLERCSHFAHVDRPETIARQIVEFLT